MIVAMNTIRIKKGHGEEIIERFQNPKEISKFEGFLGLEVLKKLNGKDEDQIRICTRWVDEASFNVWLHSPEFKASHSKSAEERENSPLLGADFALLEVAISSNNK